MTGEERRRQLIKELEISAKPMPGAVLARKMGVAADAAEKYAFTELYDSTKTVARQIAEKNKYQMVGHISSSRAPRR